MKRLLFIFSTILLLAFTARGQTVPQGMTFQGLARNATGQVMHGQDIHLQVALRTGGPEGAIVFREIHRATTNELGLFNLVIGAGDHAPATLADVPWSTGNIWLELSLDEAANNQFRPIHSARLMAVPYVFHAETTENLAVESMEKERCNSHGYPNWGLYGHASNDLYVEDYYFVGTKATDPPQPLVMKTLGKEWMRITGDQKIDVKGILSLKNLLIDANENYRAPQNTGVLSDKNFKSYPMQISGGVQGMAIEIDGERTTGNNFVSFWGPGILGQIEGQTRSDIYKAFGLREDFISINDIVNELFDADPFAVPPLRNWFFRGVITNGLPFAEAIACLAGVDPWESAVNVAWGVLNSAQLVTTIFYELEHAGVSFQSGGADYAEWLEKADPKQQLLPGQIVGVKGGKVSLTTVGADHLFVVSTNPVVLGNMTPAEKRSEWERIAFLGQAPVWVLGEVAAGDFIVPTGKGNGLGRAVSPGEMRLEDYGKVVGIAWSSSGQRPVNLIQTAIGLHANHLTSSLVQEEQKIEAIRKQLQLAVNYLSKLDGVPAPITAKDPVVLPEAEETPDQSFEAWLAAHPEWIEQSFDQVRQFCKDLDINLEEYPYLQEILDDPIEVIRAYHNGKYGPSLQDIKARMKEGHE